VDFLILAPCKRKLCNRYALSFVINHRLHSTQNFLSVIPPKYHTTRISRTYLQTVVTISCFARTNLSSQKRICITEAARPRDSVNIASEYEQELSNLLYSGTKLFVLRIFYCLAGSRKSLFHNSRIRITVEKIYINFTPCLSLIFNLSDLHIVLAGTKNGQCHWEVEQDLNVHDD
jgi:hypothetical protein